MELTEEQIDAIAQKIAERVLARLPRPAYYQAPTVSPNPYHPYQLPQVWCVM